MKDINPLYLGDEHKDKMGLSSQDSDSEDQPPSVKIARVLSHETPKQAVDLILRLLEFAPKKRITAQ